MANRDELGNLTKEFFLRHWREEALGAPPVWDFSWELRGAAPNGRLGGLYALSRAQELLYVGLGSSRGGGDYPDRGISRRLIAHVVRNAPDGNGYVLRPRWQGLGADSIGTLGFPQEFNYLAPALEDYLIGRLNPLENTLKRTAVEPIA